MTNVADYAAQANLRVAELVDPAAVSCLLEGRGATAHRQSPLRDCRSQGAPHIQFGLSSDVEDLLIALASPRGRLTLQIILANQLVETTYFACHESDELTGFWSKGEQFLLTHPWSTSKVLDIVADALTPSAAAPASNVEWRMSVAGGLALLAVIDFSKTVHLQSMLDRKPITGFRIPCHELAALCQDSLERPDARWLLTLVSQSIPAFANPDATLVVNGLGELCESGLLQRSKSESNSFYPTEAIFELLQQLLSPLPAVSLVTESFETPTANLQRVIMRGHSLWMLDIDPSSSSSHPVRVSQVDSVTCLAELSTQLERMILRQRPQEKQSAQTQFCRKCGAGFGVDDRFCRSCGTAINA